MLYDEIVTTNWGTIPRCCLTLVLFIPWPESTIYLPMCRHKPSLFLFFCSYMMLVSVCLMNLVTAVIVERSLDQAEQDKHVAKIHKRNLVERMMPKLMEMFKRLDVNDDGRITLEEFANCPDDVRDHFRELFDAEDLIELFEVSLG